RDDYPGMSAEWRKVNLICSLESDESGQHIVITKQPMPPMRGDLMALFDRAELTKYFTEEELPPETAAAGPLAAGQLAAPAAAAADGARAPADAPEASQQPPAREETH